MAKVPPREDAPALAEVSLYGDELEPGALVGPWVVEARVHPGVTAWLYHATHANTRAPAAVKVLRSEYNHVSEVLHRFKQEADTLQALRHPNIVEVLEYGELRDGRPWLAMEWLPGESMDRWLAHRGVFSTAEALTVMEELGGALHFAHRQGVLHRDLKAQNVMVVPRAEGFTVKLVDFGIARVQRPEGLSSLTSAGAVLGTPVAMAPEQIRGQAVDARTDLYALGVLLFQLLTGQLPFEGTSAVEVEEQHLHAPPPLLGERVHAPPALEAVVQRCLAKRPEERWPDVPAFLDALRAALAPVTSPPWAAGIYVDVRFPEACEDPTDEDLDAKESALDAARDALEAAGWMFAVDGGNVLLAWRALPEEALARTRALEALRTLAEEVLARACAVAGSRVHVRVYAHASPSEVTRDAQGRPRLAGGELLRLDRWAMDGKAGTVTWAHRPVPR